MIKNIMAFLIAIVFSWVHLAGAVSTDMLVTEDSIEPNQTTSAECLAGTVYLQSVCFLSDGDTNKCIDLMFLYGVPCVFFQWYRDDEISMTQCMIGAVYTQVACLACDGDALKCTALALYTFYLPCIYRAITNNNDTASGE